VIDVAGVDVWTLVPLVDCSSGPGYGPCKAGDEVSYDLKRAEGFEPAKRRWITVDTRRTGPKGRFRAAYRFTSTRSTTVYRFRALVRGENGYPFVTAHSGTVRVTVRP
jgi:hypothetical protein